MMQLDGKLEVLEVGNIILVFLINPDPPKSSIQIFDPVKKIYPS